ncbi:MAG: MaoC/PaaZ C-terminal domain-containing protein [Candidatus Binatia bacterium]
MAFDSIDVGDELPPLRLTLSAAQVKQYAVAANMPGGRFMGDEEARAEGLPGQIVPGNMSLALFSRLLTSWAGGGRLQRLSATFRALVRPNVALVVSAVVTEKHVSDHGNFLECDLLLETAEGDRLVTGTATMAF